MSIRQCRKFDIMTKIVSMSIWNDYHQQLSRYVLRRPEIGAGLALFSLTLNKVCFKNAQKNSFKKKHLTYDSKVNFQLELLTPEVIEISRYIGTFFGLNFIDHAQNFVMISSDPISKRKNIKSCVDVGWPFGCLHFLSTSIIGSTGPSFWKI